MFARSGSVLALGIVAPCLFGSADAFAASATALAEFTGLAVRTDGTAALVFTGSDLLEAVGTTDGGIADPLNDDMTFASAVSLFGEGTATNGGVFGASSFATATELVLSSALTFLDAEIELSGRGNVMIDISYTLDVDTFDNLADGFANAGLEARTSFAAGSVGLAADGLPGLADGDTLSGVLTLSFFIDVDPLLGPIGDVLFLHTYASAQASPVPLPAAAWLLAPALAGVATMRRRVEAA
ncbi:MAG: hypothetical protein AB7O21_01745 [Gammaproteobacteria bacterium]